MSRRATADWSAGILAIVFFALGALVVVKPAVDHWSDLYRGDPYRASTTTQTVRAKPAGQPVVRTTTTRKESVSFAERMLGKGGLLFLRLAMVVLAAFLAAAVLHRVVLGSYGLRQGTMPDSAPPASPKHEFNGAAPALEAAHVENGSTGDGPTAAPDTAGPELASSIGKFVSWRREELGLSQRELAKRAGISHTVISRLESGQQVPSPKTLERLAEAFRSE